MAEPLVVLCDRAKLGLSLYMLGTGSIYGTERIDSHLFFIHFHKFNLFLLTKFVTLFLETISFHLQSHHLVPGETQILTVPQVGK